MHVESAAASSIRDEPTVTDRIAMLSSVARVAGHVLHDSVLDPSAAEPTDVPWSLDAVTLPWLNAVLCEHGHGAEITGCAWGAGSEGTTVRRTLMLERNEAAIQAGLPATLFAKSAPGLFHRIGQGLSRTMIAEANFNRTLWRQVSIERPRGYFSAYDLASCRTIHLMEDLVATKGATFCTPTTPIDRAQAEDVVCTLATLHGTFWESPELDRSLSWLQPWPAFLESAFRMHDLKRFHSKGFRRARAFIPGPISDREDQVWEAVLRSLDVHFAGPHTVAHGDVHLGNWYVTRAGRMGLCDWQVLTRAHWSRDFAYAVSTTLPVEHRREWERDLLSIYLDGLRSSGGPEISFDEGWLRYRQQLCAALIFWTPTYEPPTWLPSEMQPKSTAEEMIRRITTAIDDLDTLAA